MVWAAAVLTATGWCTPPTLHQSRREHCPLDQPANCDCDTIAVSQLSASSALLGGCPLNHLSLSPPPLVQRPLNHSPISASSALLGGCPLNHLSFVCLCAAIFVSTLCPAVSDSSLCPAASVSSLCLAASVSSLCLAASVSSLCPAASVSTLCPAASVSSHCVAGCVLNQSPISASLAPSAGCLLNQSPTATPRAVSSHCADDVGCWAGCCGAGCCTVPAIGACNWSLGMAVLS